MPTQSSTVAIAVIVSIVAAIVVGGGVGYYLYKRFGNKGELVDSHSGRDKVDQSSRPDISQIGPDVMF